MGNSTWKLCHSNVTTPVLIGNNEDNGDFTASEPVVILVKWVGILDAGTSYLGRSEAFPRFHILVILLCNFRYDFVKIQTLHQGDIKDLEYEILEARIMKKLKLFMKQREQEHKFEQLKDAKFLTKGRFPYHYLLRSSY